MSNGNNWRDDLRALINYDVLRAMDGQTGGDAMINGVMDWFGERGMIERYQVEGRAYFWVPTFARYQGKTTKEAESDYPPPPESVPELVQTNSAPSPELVQTNSAPSPEPVQTNSAPSPEPVQTNSGTDADAEEMQKRTDADAEENDSGDRARSELFRLVQASGVLISSSMQAEQWAALLEITDDLELIGEAFAEAAKTNVRPSPKWIRAVLERCLREGVRPGQWKGARASPGRGRARDPAPSVEEYMTPEAIEANERAFKEMGL